MFELFLVAYPWDLPTEDVGGVWDHLRGEVGVTGLSLWSAMSPAVELRASTRRPRVFRSRGGVFFQPTQRHYAQTRCQPIVSSWITMGDPLAPVAKACAGHGLSLRAIVSAAATGRMAERYPEFACRSAMGDESRDRLCLANGEVQAYLQGMVLDLSTQAGVTALTLADFDIRWSDADDLRSHLPLGSMERTLLAVCFCASCVQRSQDAGIDVEAARRVVGQAVDRAFEQGPDEETPVEDFIAEHQSLAEHRRRQDEDLNALLRKLKETCRCELLLERPASDSSAGVASRLDFSIPSAVITLIDDPARLSGVTPTRGRRNEFRISAASAIGPAASRLVGILPEAVKAGFAAVEIGHFGLLSESAMTTLKQAIRFARRSSPG